jgi:NAD(P)-dependent dehydrogenase (short-subunit alcohol dehydrogenase family)
MKKGLFNEKIVVITGASSGIGRELALQLAEQGAWLALAARDKKRFKEVVAECLSRGGRALAVSTDVGERRDCDKLIRKTVKEYGRLDVLVNNAGISMWALFEEIKDLNLFEKIMRVNYLGSVWCTHFALPHLKESKGLIVGVSSLTGKIGVPTRSGYAASKHAMAGFFDTLRIELAPHGVGVTMIYPGFVATEMRERALGPDGKALVQSPMQESKLMPVQKCVKLIVKAMEKRKRELVMTAKGRLGLWIKLFAPGMMDQTAAKAIEKGR